MPRRFALTMCALWAACLWAAFGVALAQVPPAVVLPGSSGIAPSLGLAPPSGWPGIDGYLELSQRLGTAAAPYSLYDPNAFEGFAEFGTEYMGVPLRIEAFGTTQDLRQVPKSSYVRFRYDAEAMRSGLLKRIDASRALHAQASTQYGAIRQVYGGHLGKLARQRQALAAQLEQAVRDSAAAFQEDMLPSATLDSLPKRPFQGALDSAGAKALDSAKTKAKNAAEAKASDGAQAVGHPLLQIESAQVQRIAAKRQAASARLAKLRASASSLQADIGRYQTQLDSISKGVSADSLSAAISSSRSDIAELSNRELLKAASGSAPARAFTRAAAGFTAFEAGVFAAQLSEFTLAGSQMNGLHAGYELGKVQADALGGWVQYVGREGEVTSYRTAAGSLETTMLKGQRIKGMYLAFDASPPQPGTGEGFYPRAIPKGASAWQPAAVAAVSYAGTIGKGLRLSGELAGPGLVQGTVPTLGRGDIAWQAAAEGEVPRLPVALHASAQQAGRDFYNPLLPLGLSGTNRYALGATGHLFRHKLTWGAERQVMERQGAEEASSSATNRRWGFEAAWRTKRWPSVAASYKPFATFRAFSDTLAVQQRPLVGSVWSLRSAYQVKGLHGRSWRFAASYVASQSVIDTLAYGCTVMQATAIYTTKKATATTTLCRSVVAAPEAMEGIPNMLNASTTMQMNVKAGLALQASVSAGRAPYGLAQYGCGAGVRWAGKGRLGFGANVGASRFRLQQSMGWQGLYSGTLSGRWVFAKG